MTITQENLTQFRRHLILEEREGGTVATYMTALRQFAAFCGENPLCKELVLQYKATLLEKYAVSTANSKIGPVNLFLRFFGREDCTVRRVRIQRQLYYPQEKELYYEEYVRLVGAARTMGDEQTALVLQTLCATGIRVSELRFFTREAVLRGHATVYNKGKVRQILIPGCLCDLLREYGERRGIPQGPLFLTAAGKPLDRTLVWRRMKNLCAAAEVAPQKVHPHALRHLFAVTFYQRYRDPMSLADLLGHASVDTTRIYTATDGREQQRQLDELRLVV